jgi:hypothetical protein
MEDVVLLNKKIKISNIEITARLHNLTPERLAYNIAKHYYKKRLRLIEKWWEEGRSDETKQTCD